LIFTYKTQANLSLLSPERAPDDFLNWAKGVFICGTGCFS